MSISGAMIALPEFICALKWLIRAFPEFLSLLTIKIYAYTLN